MLIRSLSRLECTSLLAANRFGHLACARDGQPYVVPVFFAYEDNRLYSFSMLGKKIDCMRANPLVSFIVEERTNGRQWKSVVVDGRYEELAERPQRDVAWRLLSKDPDWWEPGGWKPETPPVLDHSDHIFFRIIVDRLSGRESQTT